MPVRDGIQPVVWTCIFAEAVRLGFLLISVGILMACDFELGWDEGDRSEFWKARQVDWLAAAGVEVGLDVLEDGRLCGGIAASATDTGHCLLELVTIDLCFSTRIALCCLFWFFSWFWLGRLAG